MNYQPELYNKDWFAWQHEGAFISAEIMLSYFFSKILKPHSVIDIGCGTGVWLKVAELLGTERILGLDGCHHDMTFISGGDYIQIDFEENIPDLKEQFDLAICLEVAEHLSEECAGNLVQKLCSYSDCILFSAASPGQGGDGHINEQPIEYWIDMFTKQGYEIADMIRPTLWGMPCIEYWYIHNTYIFYKKGNEKLYELFSHEPKLSLVSKGEKEGIKYWEAKTKIIINLSYEIYHHFSNKEIEDAMIKMSLLKFLIKGLSETNVVK